MDKSIYKDYNNIIENYSISCVGARIANYNDIEQKALNERVLFYFKTIAKKCFPQYNERKYYVMGDTIMARVAIFTGYVEQQEENSMEDRINNFICDKKIIKVTQSQSYKAAIGVTSLTVTVFYE